MLLLQICEAGKWLLEETQTLSFEPGRKAIEGCLIPKCYSKMPGINRGFLVYLVRCQVADDLITKEIQCDAVIVCSGQLCPDLIYVKPGGFFQIPARDGKVKNAGSHGSILHAHLQAGEMPLRASASGTIVRNIYSSFNISGINLSAAITLYAEIATNAVG